MTEIAIQGIQNLNLGTGESIMLQQGYIDHDITIRNTAKSEIKTSDVVSLGRVISNATQYRAIIICVTGMYNGANGGCVASVGINCNDPNIGSRSSGGSMFCGVFVPSQDSVSISPWARDNGAQGCSAWVSGTAIYGIR